MSSPHRDCATQTSSSMTGLTVVIDDATSSNYDTSHTSIAGDTITACECRHGTTFPFKSFERSNRSHDTLSAARRHFAKYEQRQLQEVNDEIELGWDCGICLETAEDPCVTRCGHLYCQSHLNHWLSTHPSCPVCKALCTPAQDVVPIFSRGRTSPVSFSPISSAPSSPTRFDEVFHDHHVASLGQERSRSGSPTLPDIHEPWTGMTEVDPIMSDYDITLGERISWTPTTPSSSLSHIQPHPHPLTTSHLLAHYLGIALRIVGVGIILGVLLR